MFSIGVIRATRVANLALGRLILVEVVDTLTKPVAHLPQITDRCAKEVTLLAA